MKLKVGDTGLLIPKIFFKGIERVDINEKNGLIIIIPDNTKDPIMDFGTDPVECIIDDGSENHDKYLYDGRT